MDEPKTLFDKLWNKHVVRNFSDGRTLLHIDTHFVQEVTSPGAFDALRQMSRPVRSPDLTFGVIDHSISTRPGRTAATYEPTRERIEAFQRNCRDFGIRFFDVNDPEQGIVHVVSPEFGMALPGSTFVCADSHTSTIGGIGALAWGIGTTQVLQVLATQMLIQRKPRTMSVKFNGKINQGVFAKDLILYLISQYGIGGGAGYAIEFSGPALESLPLEGRMTVCNMSIEFGGRNGMVAVDDATVDYVHGRRFAPQGTEWDKAVAEWKTLHSDPGAKFDKEIEIDCSKIGPLVSWGNTPAEVVAIDQPIPDPGSVGDPDQRKMIERAIAYMDLTPGKTIEGTKIDVAFIGSCTNARLSDLEEAARVVKGRKVADGVFALVVPGSTQVKKAAEAKGLDKVFEEAGFQWREAGCSMCLGANDDAVGPGTRTISTANRNFEHRQGRDTRTHIASPAMVAAAALAGAITDVRKFY